MPITEETYEMMKEKGFPDIGRQPKKADILKQLDEYNILVAMKKKDGTWKTYASTSIDEEVALSQFFLDRA